MLHNSNYAMKIKMEIKFKDKEVLIVGTGASGIAAATLLIEKEAKVILQESKKEISVLEIKKKLPKGYNCRIIIGKLNEDEIDKLELVILSPGVPTDLEEINMIRQRKIPIWSEIELAYSFSKGKIAAITGTNGKTTTTTLVGEIMKTYYESVFVVGNIGLPYTNIVKDIADCSVTVAELSSFQLETIDLYKPDVSAILNITPDHLDRHHTMENYIKAKLNITKNQGKNEFCVLNYEDNILREIGKKLNTNVVYFSSKRKLEQGVYLEKDEIRYKEDQKEITIVNIHDLKLLGVHNYENVMAAILISIKMKVPIAYIQKAIIAFQGVEHRIEYVAEKNGVKYYNDSKGTNPDAAIKAIEAMITPTVLIGGGYDKEANYDQWIEAFNGKVTYLVLLGQTKEKIAKTAREHGFYQIILVKDLKEAVEVCAQKAQPGESVLLSPACASWGMFENYEQRGKMFKDYVNQL